MDHTNKYGESKVKKGCTLPLTGKCVVDLLITDLAVFEFKANAMTLLELQPGVTLDEVKRATEAEFQVGIGV